MKRFLLSIICTVVVLCGNAQNVVMENPDSAKNFIKFGQFYRYLAGMYVDEINSEELVEKAIVSMLAELDPHSSYIDAKDMEGVNASFDGSFGGIGIEFRVVEDTLRVVNTTSGGPSSQVGILPNDRIITVDNKSIIGIKTNEVAGVLRGPKGTKVGVEIIRAGSNEPLNFTITRDDISLSTVDAAYKIDDHIGYIRVNRFGRTTMSDFEKAFRELGNIDSFILDLRENGGGLMDQAVDLANFFLPAGRVITTSEGRVIGTQDYSSQKDGEFLTGKVVVLLNENSASGSELAAGALQDWDRATVIGRESFGKGLIQRQFPLNDGSAVRITVGRYLTPTGRAIQRPFEKGKKDD